MDNTNERKNVDSPRAAPSSPSFIYNPALVFLPLRIFNEGQETRWRKGFGNQARHCPLPKPSALRIDSPVGHVTTWKTVPKPFLFRSSGFSLLPLSCNVPPCNATRVEEALPIRWGSPQRQRKSMRLSLIFTTR